MKLVLDYPWCTTRTVEATCRERWQPIILDLFAELDPFIRHRGTSVEVLWLREKNGMLDPGLRFSGGRHDVETLEAICLDAIRRTKTCQICGEPRCLRHR